MGIDKKWGIGFAIVIMLVVGYYVFKPTYEIKFFKLGFYPHVYLTRIVYSSFFGRQLLYIYGKYEHESYPNKDYILLKDFSGFDSMSEVIADSDTNNIITIYSTAGPAIYRNPTNSGKIISMQVENVAYQRMIEEQRGVFIQTE